MDYLIPHFIRAYILTLVLQTSQMSIISSSSKRICSKVDLIS